MNFVVAMQHISHTVDSSHQLGGRARAESRADIMLSSMRCHREGVYNGVWGEEVVIVCELCAGAGAGLRQTIPCLDVSSSSNEITKTRIRYFNFVFVVPRDYNAGFVSSAL